MVIIPFYGMLNQCPGAPVSRTQIIKRNQTKGKIGRKILQQKRIIFI